MKNPSPKIRAARLSIVTATSLAVLKLIAGGLTGSMAVISSAIDSILDILMSGINFLAIRQAEQPADKGHPFGHGKFETVATIIQSFFIALSGSWIIFESIRRLIRGVELTRLEGGITALVVSSAASLWISRHLRKVAKETDSSALRADSLHFSMDIYTNLALVAGLAIISFFDIPWLDPTLSIFVAIYIMTEAFKLIRHGMRDVLDEELPEPIHRKITQLIEEHKDYLIDYHHLRTRRAGSHKFIDFHLTVCKHISVEEAHSIADHLESEIQDEILGSDVTIHIEPCDFDECSEREYCPLKKSKKKRSAE